MVVDHGCFGQKKIIQWAVRILGNDGFKMRFFDRKTMMEESILGNGTDNECIIVEFDEPFGKAIDSSKVHLDARAVESWKTFLRNKVAVARADQFWCTLVKPVRPLVICHEKDFTDPRGKFFHAAEPVAEQIPVSVSLLAGRGVVRVAIGKILLLFRAPRRVAPVHPEKDEVDVGWDMGGVISHSFGRMCNSFCSVT